MKIPRHLPPLCMITSYLKTIFAGGGANCFIGFCERNLRAGGVSGEFGYSSSKVIIPLRKLVNLLNSYIPTCHGCSTRISRDFCLCLVVPVTRGSFTLTKSLRG